MELTSDGKDVTSPVCRGVSQKTLCPGVWRTSKMNEDEDVPNVTSSVLQPVCLLPLVAHYVVISVRLMLNQPTEVTWVSGAPLANCEV